MKIRILKQKKSWVLFRICLLKAQPIKPNLGENGLDWLFYLVGNFQTAPTIFFHIFKNCLNDFFKNPQTRNARIFLPLNISAVGCVYQLCSKYSPCLVWFQLVRSLVQYGSQTILNIVKFGDKECFDKEQICVEESFPVSNCQFSS